MIYADNAATTKLDIDAFEAMKPYLLQEYGNPSQPYFFSRATKKALRKAREIIANCIGALPEEIYFTSGGTESDNWAIKGVVHGKKKGIITSVIEHHAILNACAATEKFGTNVKYLLADEKGLVSSDELEAIINDDTALVSVMYANNEIGTIEPIKELAEIAHRHGALMHTDAVQAVGHVPIDVNYMVIDMLSASAHKFNGPRGIGFLYIREGTCLTPFFDGGAQEKNMRAGTENVAAIVAMATALQKNCEKMKEVEVRLLNIESKFFSILDNNYLEYSQNGAYPKIPGNINISIKGTSGEMLLHRLDLKGICVSTGSACDSVNTQVSHVIKAISVPEEYAQGTIRISFGRDNSEEEAIVVAETILEIIQGKNGQVEKLEGKS